ncbi:MAG TPA: hypothetical protein VGH28_20570 [Polyangiaceae bacterium]
MLDKNGVCRWAVAQPGHTAEKVPERIVGAQYLATLDVTADGALVDLPRIGCPMLFAATDETGRVRLVRTPPLLRFEDRREGAMRRPLASKFDMEPLTPQVPRAYDDDATPIAPLSSYVAELAPASERQRQSSPPESMPLPLTRQTTGTRPVSHSSPFLPPPRTPLPPPPRARIAARIPPAPSMPLSATGSGLRASPAPGVQSIPVRTRAANMSLKKLARGK